MFWFLCRQCAGSLIGHRVLLMALSRHDILANKITELAEEVRALGTPHPGSGELSRSYPFQEFSPRIFVVVDQGARHGPFTEDELVDWRERPFDILFDTTLNSLWVRHEDAKPPASIPLGGPGQRREFSSVLEILRVFAEHPGRLFTNRIFCRYAERKLTLEDKTFIKYVERLRVLIRDQEPRSGRFIVTDMGVDRSVSPTRSAYYANPKLRWRVIRYLPELSSENPFWRPSAPQGPE